MYTASMKKTTRDCLNRYQDLMEKTMQFLHHQYQLECWVRSDLMAQPGHEEILLETQELLEKLNKMLPHLNRIHTELNIKIPSMRLFAHNPEQSTKQFFNALDALDRLEEAAAYEQAMQHPQISELITMMEIPSPSSAQVIHETIHAYFTYAHKVINSLLRKESHLIPQLCYLNYCVQAGRALKIAHRILKPSIKITPPEKNKHSRGALVKARVLNKATYTMEKHSTSEDSWQIASTTEAVGSNPNPNKELCNTLHHCVSKYGLSTLMQRAIENSSVAVKFSWALNIIGYDMGLYDGDEVTSNLEVLLNLPFNLTIGPAPHFRSDERGRSAALDIPLSYLVLEESTLNVKDKYIAKVMRMLLQIHLMCDHIDQFDTDQKAFWDYAADLLLTAHNTFKITMPNGRYWDGEHLWVSITHQNIPVYRYIRASINDLHLDYGKIITPQVLIPQIQEQISLWANRPSTPPKQEKRPSTPPKQEKRPSIPKVRRISSSRMSLGLFDRTGQSLSNLPTIPTPRKKQTEATQITPETSCQSTFPRLSPPPEVEDVNDENSPPKPPIFTLKLYSAVVKPKALKAEVLPKLLEARTYSAVVGN